MAVRKWALGATALATLLFAGCTNGDSESSDWRGIPLVEETPLDLRPYEADPCGILDERDAIALGFDHSNGGEYDFGGNPACQLWPIGVDPHPNVERVTLHVYLSRDSTLWGRDATTVAGYPAAIQSESPDCRLFVAVSAEHAFFAAHASSRNPSGREAPGDCDIARAAAEAIVENLRGDR